MIGKKIALCISKVGIDFKYTIICSAIILLYLSSDFVMCFITSIDASIFLLT